MKRIIIEDIPKWNVAKKTRPIKAKPAIAVMVDRSVLSKFLIDTLEGKEPLGDGSLICLGESNDIWQQMPSKLIKKYEVVDVDKDGWMICNPRPDVSVNCIQITDQAFIKYYIKAGWGEEFVVEDETILIQKASYGDYICQDRSDPTDVWIVAEKIFKNTYNIIT